jgi:hypothetical protein
MVSSSSAVCSSDLVSYFDSLPLSVRSSLLQLLPSSVVEAMNAGAKMRQRWRYVVPDLLVLSLCYLSVSDFVHVRSVSVHWNKASKNERAWKHSQHAFQHLIDRRSCQLIPLSLSFLRSCSLSSNCLTDDFLFSLSRLPRLAHIQLPLCNSLPTAFMDFLSHENSPLTSLDISLVIERYGGYLPLDFFSALSKLKRLAFLRIKAEKHKQIQNFTSVRKSQLKLIGLSLSVSDVLQDDLTALSESDSIQTLELLDFTGCSVTDDLLVQIGLFNELRALSIQKHEISQITSSGLSSLTKCKNIQWMNLEGQECLKDDSLTIINSFHKLQWLNLNDCFGLSSSSLEKLKFNHRIRVLGLRNCCVDDRLLHHLAENLKQLEAIDLRQCSQITIKAIQSFVNKCQKLKCIGLPSHLLGLLNNISVPADNQASLLDSLTLPSSSRKLFELYSSNQFVWNIEENEIINSRSNNHFVIPPSSIDECSPLSMDETEFSSSDSDMEYLPNLPSFTRSYSNSSTDVSPTSNQSSFLSPLLRPSCHVSNYFDHSI